MMKMDNNDDTETVEKIVNKITDDIVEEEEFSIDERTLELIKEEVRKKILERIKKRKPPPVEKEEFLRFGLNVRIQHILLAIAVIILIITGLPIKFHETGWAGFILKIIGGIQISRVVHRVAAALLTVVGIYHLFWIIFSKEGRKEFYYLLPRFKDIKDFFINVAYFLGISKEKPKFDRFSYVEKFDYWAVYWGMVIMIGSGIVLTFFPYVVAFVPKFVFDIAREIHSDEALLATLAIVIWHWYNAHFNPEVFPLNPTIFTGKIPKERMIKEHYLEYQRLVGQVEEETVKKENQD